MDRLIDILIAAALFSIAVMSASFAGILILALIQAMKDTL